ncbi:pathogenesis-related protein PR-1-like [Andrographis paniculata]|uniref:pathogenesis-related protein PR-1-like n=1 Tax=Andrographis paniculata TaxID=175694 RepID=UPI0021E7DF99|nr:pathogenesis-related protein PR-1-like [Andrographis paniculata]
MMANFHGESRIFRFLIAAAALVGTAAATVIHPIPRESLRKREPLPLPPLLPPPFVPKFDYEQREFVKAHNDLRRTVNTPPLIWSAELTASAQAWAQLRREDCNYRLHSPNRHGENIFYMEYKDFTPTEIVQRWFNESRFYDSTNDACRCNPPMESCECRHYLAIVWSTTRQIGCSSAVYCDAQKGIIVVCQYDPPGLDININPFTGAPIARKPAFPA